MDPEFYTILAEQKSAIILAVAAGAAVMLAAYIMRGLANRAAMDPKVILRRCSWELDLVRQEMQHYPATREVHEIFAGLDSAQQTIDRVAGRLK